MLIISTFLSSLLNHSTYVSLIALFFLILSSRLKINKKELLFFVVTLLIITLSAMLFAVKNDVGVHEDLKKAFVNNYVYLLCLMLFYLFFLSKIKNDLEYVDKSIKIVVIIHVCAFFIQGIVLFASDEYLDLVKLFTGEESRYINYDVASVITKYRMTGWYIEPSTYASAMTALILSRTTIASIKNRNNKFLDYISALTILLSFSTAAIFYGTICLVCLLIHDSRFISRKKKLLIVLLFFVSVFILCNLFLAEIIAKFTSTSAMRYGLIGFLFENRQGFDLYFGYGLFGVERELYDLATDSDVNYRIASLNDSGLFIYLIVKFGLFGIVLTILLYSFLARNILGFLCISALLVTKLSYINMIASIPLLLLYYETYYKNESCSN